MGVTGYEVQMYHHIERSTKALERLAGAVERMAPPVPDRLTAHLGRESLHLVQEMAGWSTRQEIEDAGGDYRDDDDPLDDLIIRARKILESP